MTAPITQAEAYAAEIRALKQDLAAKTSDFDAALRKISALRDEVADFQAACKSACQQRDDLAARVTALQAAVDSKADWRPPAPPALRMVEGGLYRNPLGAEVRLAVLQRHVLAPGLWLAEGDFTRELVTAEGLAACGYALVTEEARDGE